MDIFWLLLGGGVWWWIYFGWWQVEVGIGEWWWIYFGWWWVVVGDGEWWWIYFGWWWVVFGGGIVQSNPIRKTKNTHLYKKTSISIKRRVIEKLQYPAKFLVQSQQQKHQKKA